MPAAPVEAALVGIRFAQAPGSFAGTGVLVTDTTVLTCAHVVSRALGRPEASAPDPQDRLSLSFPLTGEPDAAVDAGIALLQPRNTGEPGDVAVLRLPPPLPPGAHPVPLVAVDAPSRTDVLVGGLPLDRGLVAWARCLVLAHAAPGLLQIEDQRTLGMRVQPGFSGGPLWSEVHQGVVGMVAMVDPGPERRTSFAISGRALSRAAGEATGAGTVPPAPYRGLHAFEEADRDLFFGREELARTVAADLARRGRNVLLAGPSGAGKSSLLLAGVLPELEEADRARCLVVRPDDLARREEELERAAAGEGPHRFIVVDQVEEAVEAEEAAGEAGRGLLARVAAAARTATGPRCLFAVRSDHLDAVRGRLGIAPGDGPVGAAWQPHEVPRMNDDQLRRAIEGPLPPGAHFAPGMVPRLLDAARGGDPDTPPLPLLQLTLARLWDRRTSAGVIGHEAYDELHGLSGAVDGYAERIWERLGEEDRGVARGLFLRMVRVLREAPPVGRSVPVADLGEAEADLVRRPALDGLVAAHGRGDRAVVRFTHDAVIAHWSRLRAWVEADRAFLTWQDELRGDVERWSRAGEDTSLLLRGPALARGREAARDRHRDLGPAELRYLEASAGQERRRRTRKRLWTVGLSALLAVLLTVVLAAEAWRRQAGEGERVSASQQIAAQVKESFRQSGATLLQAVAAYRTAPTQEAAEVLFTAYMQTRHLDRLLSPPGLEYGAGDGAALTRGLDRVGMRSGDRMLLWRRTAEGYVEEEISGTAALAGTLSADGSRTALRVPGGVRIHDADGGRLATVPLESDEEAGFLSLSPQGTYAAFYDAAEAEIAVHTADRAAEEVLRLPAGTGGGRPPSFALSERTLYVEGGGDGLGLEEPLGVDLEDGSRTVLDGSFFSSSLQTGRVVRFAPGERESALLTCRETPVEESFDGPPESDIAVHRPAEADTGDRFTAPVECSESIGFGLDGRYAAASGRTWDRYYLDVDAGEVIGGAAPYGQGTRVVPASAGSGLLRTAHLGGDYEGVGIGTVAPEGLSGRLDTLGLTVSGGGDLVLTLRNPFRYEGGPPRGDGVELWDREGERLGAVDLPDAAAATARDTHLVLAGRERVQVHETRSRAPLWGVDLPGSDEPQALVADDDAHVLIVEDSGRARAYALEGGDPVGPAFPLPLPESAGPGGARMPLTMDEIPGRPLVYRVVGPDGASLQTWDARTGERTGTEPLPTGGALAAFHHDPDDAGHGVAYSYDEDDGWQVELWRLDGRAPRKEETLVGGFGLSAVTSDRPVIAVVDGDVLRTWDYSGEERRTLPLPASSDSRVVAVHGEEGLMLTRGDHGGAQIYSLDPEEWMRHVCAVAGDRELTGAERSGMPAAAVADGVCTGG
ncbi:serine protease [Nocardiopsis suaedae]|uniref:Serine protease n=1 Tax=Nocardiopsis suaedae TaxID=3018444 RepID=A0ABT4TL03_9ACTN|nr:serine protease [Nocardiopsis suaedae]MDA2805291.1 serine protease [Nocardiopsis suaedae]